MIKSYIPRAVLVNDLSGFGRVSLTEAIPTISAMGIEACPLPTAILSTHTYRFEDYTFLDLTDEMEKIIKHWRALEINFDAVCTGYMGSSRQIELVSQFIKELKESQEKGCLAVIDPVLGDNVLTDVQTVYSDRMADLLDAMREFVSLADFITPNLTETCLLLREEYPKGPITKEQLRYYLKRLCDLGVKGAVITSVMTGEKRMSVGVYEKNQKDIEIIDCGYVDRPFHGTGDIFAAVLTGALLKGQTLYAAAEAATGFVRKCITNTMKYKDIKTEHGVIFESELSEFFGKERL